MTLSEQDRVMPRPCNYDRDTVVERATDLFWEQGYGKTSIGDLVDATGLQPGSLYAAFGNKKGLFLAVIEHYNQAFIADIRALREQPGAAIDKIATLLEEIVERQAGGRDHRGCLTVNAMLEMSDHDSDIGDRLSGYNRFLGNAFESLIEDAQREGSIDHERDTSALAMFLINNIWGLKVMCKSKPDRTAMQAVVDGVMAALNDV
jgi:TetR/AcrR family transcriptional repressor of nem operon